MVRSHLRVTFGLSLLPMADNRKDEAMLKAAVELDRTSTAESDRGKGLQDLQESAGAEPAPLHTGHV